MIKMHEAVRAARTEMNLDPATVAEAAELDTPSLIKFEAGEQEIPGHVLWRLSDLLGVPFEEIDSPETLRHHISVMAVRFRTERGFVSEQVRLAVARAATAARYYIELEKIRGRPQRYAKLNDAFPGRPTLPLTRVWTAGRDLATQLSQALSLPVPTTSVLILIKQIGVLVLWQNLPTYIAGYALCDDIHGPTIVVNVKGRNANELVRRFTLAHELCHILYDRERLQVVSSFDQYDDFFEYEDGSKDPYEVRANAFAIHLLAPEDQFTTAWQKTKDVRHVMTSFGISYEAARYHLEHYVGLPRTQRLPTKIPTGAPDHLKTAESPELWYPGFDVIPIERRHSVAALAFELWRDGLISTNKLREVLGVDLTYEELSDLAELYMESKAA